MVVASVLVEICRVALEEYSYTSSSISSNITGICYNIVPGIYPRCIYIPFDRAPVRRSVADV